MMIELPEITPKIQKKYGGRSVLYLGKEIVAVCDFSTRKQYEKLMKNLLKKYPSSKEEDYGSLYVYPKNYIHICCH